LENIIIVHLFHGSKRKKNFRAEPKELGGKFGGHVTIQIDDRVYGFYYKDIKNIHIISHKKNKSCIFQNQSISEWNAIIANKKVTSIIIPATLAEKTILTDFYNKNIENPEYDYSFFGQRCASSCYNLLKSLNKIKGGHYFFNAFYPGQLRKKLVKEAKKNNYLVYVKEGSETRIWEG
jgi:hypothetical protein